MTSPPIKAAVFDLGMVLVHFDYGIAARKLANQCSASIEEIQGVIDQSQLLCRYETGELSRNDFFEEFRKATGFQGDVESFAPLFSDIFSPIDEMIDLHRLIREQGLPTFIFSNTNDLAVEHIADTFPFFDTFSGYVYSYEEKAMKPSEEIYIKIERTTGHSGKHLLYIDDRMENIEAGRERDWTTIHHTSPTDTRQSVARLLNLSI